MLPDSADFKGPPSVLPIYFKRSTSYPAATSAPMKRRLLERRPPPMKATRSRVQLTILSTVNFPVRFLTVNSMHTTTQRYLTVISTCNRAQSWLTVNSPHTTTWRYLHDSEKHIQQNTEVADSDLQVPCEHSEQGRPDPLRGDYSVERLLQEN